MYLSFDGLTGDVYKGTCGRDILATKLKVIERCREVGIQVVLSVAVVSGLNDDQLATFCASRLKTPMSSQGSRCSLPSLPGALMPSAPCP